MLKERIKQSGLKIGYLAEQMGISRASLADKVAGRRQFKEKEIAILCKALGISVNDFFAMQGSQNAKH